MLDLDANEHVDIGKLVRVLIFPGLIETIKTVVSNAPPASHVNGSKKFDGTRASRNLSVLADSFSPHHFAVGNYREIVVDFDKRIS